jgi:predicted acyltransferase
VNSLSPNEESENENISKSEETNSRYLSIDAFRGLTIILMVFVNTIGDFSTTPWWTKHAEDIGLTYVDLIAPFFVFAIGLTYHLSYMKTKAKYGSFSAFMKFLKRYAALLGLGIIIEVRFTPDGFLFGWGAIPSIGVAGMMMLLVVSLKKHIRLIIGALLLIIYQIVISLTFNIQGVDIILSDIMYNESHGGIIGAIGYGIMLILSSVICESLEEKKQVRFIIWGLIFTVLGISTHFLVGISKRRVSGPFILISVGIGSIFYFIIWIIYDFKKFTKNKSLLLQPIGRNSLFLYFLHGIYSILVYLIFPADIHFVFVLLLTLSNIIVVAMLGIVFDKRKIYFVF